jgi:hypothetical protein
MPARGQRMSVSGALTGCVSFYLDGSSSPLASVTVSAGNAQGTHSLTAVFVSTNSNRRHVGVTQPICRRLFHSGVACIEDRFSQQLRNLHSDADPHRRLHRNHFAFLHRSAFEHKLQCFTSSSVAGRLQLSGGCYGDRG